MASLLTIIQERALGNLAAEVNPMWPKRLQPELIHKIAQFVPANLPVYDVARFELWKKGETMSKVVTADALWRKDGLQDGLFPTDSYCEGDYFTKLEHHFMCLVTVSFLCLMIDLKAFFLADLRPRQ